MLKHINSHSTHGISCSSYMQAAIQWLVHSRQRLLQAEWPHELLEHELCEQVSKRFRPVLCPVCSCQ